MKAFYFVAAVALLGQVYLARAIDVTSPEATLAAGLAINALNTKYPARLDGVISADKQACISLYCKVLILKISHLYLRAYSHWQCMMLTA